MRIDVFTLFPEAFQALSQFGIFQRAVECGLICLNVHNIRDYTHDRHHTVDDYAYGGGAGMVLKPEPVFEAVESVKAEAYPAGAAAEVPVILLTPQGRLLSHRVAQELSGHEHMIFICGHYEGIDERVREHLITDEISIGDYVLSGGELAAMVVVDAVVRLVPEVLGSPLSAVEDSHADGLLEYPQYTRPAVYRSRAVPEVLLSGNHARVDSWRREQAIRRTLKRRPELLDRAELSDKEKQLTEKLKRY
ncbi:tRNA (guanosine(37)-N1)-methyltransferase TrmD [Chloroflexota bacterium]